MKAGEGKAGSSAGRLIDQRIRDLGGWRGQTLARMRSLILEADPEVIEQVKWRGTPVWSHPRGSGGRSGIICTGEAYAKVVKLTFARGASLADPSGLFNSSLEGNTRRAIDIHEGEEVDAGAFKALVKAAVAGDDQPAKKPPVKKTAAKKAGAKKAALKSGADRKARAGASGRGEAGPVKARKGGKAPVVLLSGGNPQIAKADGDAPVQAYIDAMPGWKRDLGKRLDALIVRSVPNPPGVRKAVKWNSPLYGINPPPPAEGSPKTAKGAPKETTGWFLGFHVFTRYVKVAFFRGASLRPLPPGASKDKNTRYLDIHEDDELDEALLASWIRQASQLPGWIP